MGFWTGMDDALFFDGTFVVPRLETRLASGKSLMGKIRQGVESVVRTALARRLAKSKCHRNLCCSAAFEYQMVICLFCSAFADARVSGYHRALDLDSVHHHQFLSHFKTRSFASFALHSLGEFRRVS